MAPSYTVLVAACSSASARHRVLAQNQTFVYIIAFIIHFDHGVSEFEHTGRQSVGGTDNSAMRPAAESTDRVVRGGGKHEY